MYAKLFTKEQLITLLKEKEEGLYINTEHLENILFIYNNNNFNFNLFMYLFFFLIIKVKDTSSPMDITKEGHVVESSSLNEQSKIDSKVPEISSLQINETKKQGQYFIFYFLLYIYINNIH